MNNTTCKISKRKYVLMEENLPISKIQEWTEIKERYSGFIILMGYDDCYFSLDQDAEELSKHTDLPLEKEGLRSMVRFNHYGWDIYLNKLVKAGHKVALCDQLAGPEDILFT